MKRYCLILCIGLFAATFAFAGIEGDLNFTKVYKNSAGAVTFQHQEHTERFLDECGFCHSALRTFGGKVDKLFGHKVCLVCHESKDGPTECNQCHDQKNKSKM